MPAETSAWDRAIAYLARRDASYREIEATLLRAGHPRDEIASVLERLRERKLVDEKALAYNLASRRARQGRYGPARVRQELQGRGISRADIDDAIALAFPGDDDASRIAVAIDRFTAGRGVPDVPRERERLARRLLRGGFAPADVMRALDDVPGLDSIEDDDDAVP